MSRILLTLSVALVSLSALPPRASAQATPEAQRLAWFVGEWTYDALEGGATCEWLGDFIVQCESAWTTAAGEPVEALFLTRYDTEREVYTAHRFYSGGYTDSALGWVTGDTWTFVYEGPDGARYRFTGVETSEDKWSYTWHRSLQGGSWEQTGEGSMTKVR